MIRCTSGADLRILDPGAGTATLGIELSRSLLERGAASVHLVAIENEPDTIPYLRKSLALASGALGPRFSYDARHEDFLDYEGLFARPNELFDVAIGNPPYFKLPSSDRRGSSAPNAYARFMEIAAGLLRSGGQMCFIVPRSYASGAYFRRFRRSFHESVTLRRLHLFRSRREAFRHHKVLQENLIMVGEKEGPPTDIRITASDGIRDISTSSDILVRRDRIIDTRKPDAWIFLPETDEDIRVLDVVDSFEDRLDSMGLEINTGRVVPFRATEFLHRQPASAGSFPLLWMQHVQPGVVEWPLGDDFSKPQYLAPSTPRRLLIDNATCVLLRRFSAKEDKRRLIAAALWPGKIPGHQLGVENHLNVIRAAQGREFSPSTAAGLAVILNSTLYDRYFRLFNGNTQVSASEIRATPFPPMSVLSAIGDSLSSGQASSTATTPRSRPHVEA